MYVCIWGGGGKGPHQKRTTVQTEYLSTVAYSSLKSDTESPSI